MVHIHFISVEVNCDGVNSVRCPARITALPCRSVFLPSGVIFFVSILWPKRAEKG